MSVTHRPNAGCRRCAVLGSAIARIEEDLRGVARKASAPRYQGDPPRSLLDAIQSFKEQLVTNRKMYTDHKATEHKE